MKTKRIVSFVVAGTIFLFSETARSAEKQHVIRVVDFNSKSGVPSEIFKRSSEGKEIRLGPTDAQGVKKISGAGVSGERLRAVPKSPRYYDNSADCPLAESVTVVPVMTTDALGFSGRTMLASARAAEAAGKPAEAALILKRLALETASKDPTLAKVFEKRVLELGGEIFNVQSPKQPGGDQMSWTATPRLQKRVRDFQQDSKLPTNGILDTPTLARATELEKHKTQATTTTTRSE